MPFFFFPIIVLNFKANGTRLVGGPGQSGDAELEAAGGPERAIDQLHVADIARPNSAIGAVEGVSLSRGFQGKAHGPPGWTCRRLMPVGRRITGPNWDFPGFIYST